jgi:CRP-like cAMP-binding protein
MEKLKKYFLQSGFSENDTQIITGNFQCKVFKKGDYFVKESKISNHLAYIGVGIFQYFTLLDGEERTTYISFENSFIASLLSYLKGSPARENIRAIITSTLWMIHKNDMYKLHTQVAEFKDFYINLLEGQLCCIDQTRLDLITLNAEEHYNKLLNEEPQLLQQIPLQSLASMLGITPRHLSRLRKNIV